MSQMLVQLDISNYAIIKKVSVKFDKNLNIITGETGAGKSILIDSLNIVLGERIDWSIFAGQSEKCFVEAFFDISDNNVIKEFLIQKEIEIEGNIAYIRREINPVNKISRIFINDNPISLGDLTHIKTCILDLHQQFDTFEIFDNQTQLKYIDAFAGNFPLLKTYQAVYSEFEKEHNRLKEILEIKKQSEKDMEYYQFLNKELDETGLKENELEGIEKKLKLLTTCEKSKQIIGLCLNSITENENSITKQIQNLVSELKCIKDSSTEFENFAERLYGVNIELKELSREMSSFINKLYTNPDEIMVLTERLDLGFRLLKKHSVKSTNQLIDEHSKIKDKLSNIANIDVELNVQNKKVAELKDQSLKLAEELHFKRKSSFDLFVNQTHILLKKVGMVNSIFKVSIDKIDLNFFGFDRVEFLIDTNNTGILRPIKKIVSGGELNRLMLSIKSIIAKSLKLPSLVFDEIDTGVSGEVAKQIGDIVKTLSNNIQIICITHQAVIAAKADKHFFVYKQESDNKIATTIRELNYDERIATIAEILSGTPPTTNSLLIAREMIELG